MSTRSKFRQRGARTVAIPIEAVFVPSREPVNVDMNDPAALYTYAATSTLPGAGRGLFARRLIGPDSPIDDGEYIGEYMGGENLTPEDFRRYMFATNPERQTAYMISWLPLPMTHVTTTFTTASGRSVRKGSASSFG